MFAELAKNMKLYMIMQLICRSFNIVFLLYCQSYASKVTSSTMNDAIVSEVYACLFVTLKKLNIFEKKNVERKLEEIGLNIIIFFYLCLHLKR